MKRCRRQKITWISNILPGYISTALICFFKRLFGMSILKEMDWQGRPISGHFFLPI